jgi:hypothetical protein
LTTKEVCLAAIVPNFDYITWTVWKPNRKGIEPDGP